MVLTDRQRSDLHAGIYEYLLAQEGEHFEKAAEAMALADPSCVRESANFNDSSKSVNSAPKIENGYFTVYNPDDDDNMSVSSRYSVSSKFSMSTTSARSLSSSTNVPILEKKWTSVPRLQKKVLELERTLAANNRANASMPIATTSDNHKSPSSRSLYGGERRMLPRPPCSHAMKGHSGVISVVILHPYNTTTVSGSEDGTIKIWDYESGEYQKTLKGHTNTVQSLAFSPLGTYLASCSSDMTIKIWSFSNYNCIRTLRGHDHNISAVKFLPLPYNDLKAIQTNTPLETNKTSTTTTTGINAYAAGTSYLLSASRDKTVKLWHIETGFCEATLNEHSDWVRCLAVRDADGAVFATAGNDQIINVYDSSISGINSAPECKVIARLQGHEHVVETLAFATAPTPAELIDASKEPSYNTNSSDTNNVLNLLASGGRDRTVRLWNILTSECLATFSYHDNWVRSVILHPTGKYILSAGDDRTIRIMDIKSNRCLRTISEAHNHFISTIAMHHTLPILVSGGVDQTIRCWSLD